MIGGNVLPIEKANYLIHQEEFGMNVILTIMVAIEIITDLFIQMMD